MRVPAPSTPPSGLSTHDLQRLQVKLAFYEKPITSFDRPIENDPTELVLFMRGKTDANQTMRPVQQETATAEETCGLMRFATRAITTMCKLFKPRHADPTRCGGVVSCAKQSTPAKTATVERTRVEKKPRPARQRLLPMDESTRYRLELAGFRVQSPPPSYTVCI